MKQIVVMGDLNRWKSESDFIAEMLHLTASRAVTINLGPRQANADLNTRELRHLFPDKTLEECVGAAMRKLYGQGVADGLLCLVGSEERLYRAIDRAFAALPFGIPKIALVGEDSTWKGKKDIIHVQLPGKEYNLNPIIKICLGNTAFAISGISLCNIHNFGASTPTVATCCPQAGRSFADLGVNFISFSPGDDYLLTLLGNGYIHGLLIDERRGNYTACFELALTRGIPVVFASPKPGVNAPESISKPLTPVVVVTPICRGSVLTKDRAAAAKTPQDDSPSWLQHCPVPYIYGSKPFYAHAAKALADLLK